MEKTTLSRTLLDIEEPSMCIGKTCTSPTSHFPTRNFSLSSGPFMAASLPKPYTPWKTCPPYNLACLRSLLLLLVRLYAISSSLFGYLYEKKFNTPPPAESLHRFRCLSKKNSSFQRSIWYLVSSANLFFRPTPHNSH